MSEQSLEAGTVVKISQIIGKHISDALHLKEGMEGVVAYHNHVFRIDENTGAIDQPGAEKGDAEMFMFEMPGSKLRVGPIAKMPDNHKVVAWIVGGKLWNVTNVSFLFNGSLRWWVVRTGEILRLEGE